MRPDYISIYTTVPDRGAAERLARTLVEEGLVACANLFPIDSVYRWKGEIEVASEHGLFLKTRGELYDPVERRIREVHPYELPAIVAFPLAAGFAKYLAWIGESTHGPEHRT